MLQDRLVDFHHALWRVLTAEGKTGQLISPKAWDSLILSYMGPRTRQSCHDATWAMDRLGMIEHKPREGVIVLAPEADASWTQSEHHGAPVAS